jgi:hypothetical protein
MNVLKELVVVAILGVPPHKDPTSQTPVNVPNPNRGD